jgi:hypothetical protein
MAPDDAQGPSEGATADEAANVGDRPQDPIVERLRADPAQPPAPTLEMSGFLGDSDRPGFRRLYFTRDLDYYAEFRAGDAVDVETIPADQDPFRGEEATRLRLRRDATVEYTRVRSARPLDDYDLDIQLGRRRVADKRRPVEKVDTAAGPSCETWCYPWTCVSCPSECVGYTCGYPETACNPAGCLKEPYPSAWGSCYC